MAKELKSADEDRPSSRPVKKIALFSDGTGNSSSSPHKTNVWRLYQALDTSPEKNQTAFYDNGVGTSRFTPVALLGQGFGWGLARNVRQIYGFLCRVYEPGAEIYAFGFSRGAFTIRVVAALIASQGIIDPSEAEDEKELDKWIAASYRRFRKDSFTPSALSFFLAPLRDLLVRTWETEPAGKNGEPEGPDRAKVYPDSLSRQTIVRFLGVWDTVDAYGLPVDELTRAWDKVVWPLSAKDRNLSDRIEKACHALALDEQRESFEPMLWNERGKKVGGTVTDEELSQVWFAGVHSDVGGSYPDDSLAYVPLNWILEQSQLDGKGLHYFEYLKNQYEQRANYVGPMHDSRSGAGNFYRYAPRNMEKLCSQTKPGLWNWLKSFVNDLGDEKNEVNIVIPKVHFSVFERLKQSGDGYAPINIPAKYAIVQKSGEIVDIGHLDQKGKPLPESPSNAKKRRDNQILAWNKVWLLKALYYATLGAILGFAFYPYHSVSTEDGVLASVVPELEQLFGTFSFVIREIPGLIGKIPGLGFAEGWASRYESHPFAFMIGLLVIGGLLAVSLRLSSALKSEMRRNWHHVAERGQGSLKSDNGWRRGLADILYGKLKHDPATVTSPMGKITRASRIVLEAITVILLLVLILALIARIVFVASDAFGGICSEKSMYEVKSLPHAFEFDPTDACFATGLNVRKGQDYIIEYAVPDGFKFGNLPADVNGLRSVPIVMYLLTPWRRHLFSNWGQAIARVDNKLFDRQVLLPSARSNDAQNLLHMKITPRRNGQLYVYTNGALPLAILREIRWLRQMHQSGPVRACMRVRLVNEGAYDLQNDKLQCPIKG
ncbi:MAG: DUF2235 domain-containing protein [Rhizobiaceae bacterium]